MARRRSHVWDKDRRGYLCVEYSLDPSRDYRISIHSAQLLSTPPPRSKSYD